MQILWKKYSKENFEVNVDECGIEQGIPGFGYKYEVLKSAVVHYITKGEGIFKVDDKVYKLKKGDIFILLKGMKVEYMASIDEPWEYQWIGFNGANASEYLNRTSIVDSYAASCKEDSKIPKINYMNNITVQDIAEHVNLSRSYLYKMFIKNLKVSPQNYLINLRMYKATLLLKNTKMPIGEVANKVGYSDSLLFSKTFSKNFSISPLSYRNNKKSNN